MLARLLDSVGLLSGHDVLKGRFKDSGHRTVRVLETMSCENS